MIPIQQLRYGSWVKVGEYGLRPGKIFQVERWQIHDGAMIVQFLGKHPSGEFIQDIEPIKLTPEILKQCKGWVLHEGGECEFTESDEFWLEVHKDMNKVDVGGWFEKDTMAYVFMTKGFSSLHELQNLYYALTGQELEYNPKQ